MNDASQALDVFGAFVVTQLRDPAISLCDDLLAGRVKAPGMLPLQHELGGLNVTQKTIVRRSVLTAIDSGLHDFLFKLQEQADFGSRIQILVDGMNVVSASDGLHGELFSSEGWYARFSAYGEPPERA